MRTVSLAAAFALAFALLACAPADCDGPNAVRPAAAEAPSSLQTTTAVFDVLDGGKSVGTMDWRVMEVQDKVIVQTRLEIRVKDKPAGFESLAVYLVADRPELERVQASTRLGTFKLMEGEALVGPDDTGRGRVAHLTVRGFADRDQKPFDTPREMVKDLPLPDGCILSAPAFLFFGPRLLPRPGRMEKIVHAEVPDDIDFPAFLNLKTDCVLTRGETNDDGLAEIRLDQRFPGDNTLTLAAVTVDRDGRLVEAHLGNFVLRPAAPAAEVE